MCPNVAAPGHCWWQDCANQNFMYAWSIYLLLFNSTTQDSTCVTVLSLWTAGSVHIFIAALLLTFRTRFIPTIITYAPYMMSWHWSVGVFTDVVAIINGSDVLGVKVHTHMVCPGHAKTPLDAALPPPNRRLSVVTSR